MVDAIPFKGECYFYPILYYIYYVTRLSLTFTPTSNLDSLINYSSIHLIYCNRARLDLRIQHYRVDERKYVAKGTCLTFRSPHDVLFARGFKSVGMRELKVSILIV